jgi:hypothetical protein
MYDFFLEPPLCRKLRFWNTHERVVYISPLPSINISGVIWEAKLEGQILKMKER